MTSDIGPTAGAASKDDAANHRQAVDWLKNPSNLIALIAFSLSVLTLAMTEYRRPKDAQFNVISRSYDRYYEMNRLQIDKWYLAHLFATRDQYYRVKQVIEEGLKSQPREKMLEYLIQERAAADFIFMFYEQTSVPTLTLDTRL